MIIKTYTIPIPKGIPYLVAPPGAGILLREHQQAVVAYYKQRLLDPTLPRHTLDIAPGGSGKTTSQQAGCLKEIVDSHFMQRQLIIVPQDAIGRQFYKESTDGKPRLLRLECDESCFDVTTQTFTCSHAPSNFWVRKEFRLCDERTSDITMKVVNFLTRTEEEQIKVSKEKSAADLIMVCTHRALVLAQEYIFEHTSLRDRLKIASRNLTHRIDEAHHAGAGTDADFDTAETDGPGINYLGEIVRFICEQEDESARIHMSTATPYRSDGSRLFPEKYDNDFKRFNLSLNEHLSHSSIRTVILRLETFDKVVNNPLEIILENIGHPLELAPIIVHPEMEHKWLKDKDKFAVAAQWKRRLKKLGWRVGDFIGKEQKTTKRETLNHPETFNLFLMCHMGREGLDLPHAFWLHHTAIENSLWLSVQTFYRVIRTYEGKETVGLTYYVPEFTVEEALTAEGNFAARTAAMMLDILADKVKPSYPSKKKDKTGEPIKTDLIEDLSTVHSNPAQVWGEVWDALTLRLRTLSEDKQILGVQQTLVDSGISEENVTDLDLAKRFVDNYKKSVVSPVDPKRPQNQGPQEVYPFLDPLDKAAVMTAFGPSTTLDLKRIEDELTSNWDKFYPSILKKAKDMDEPAA
jgi:hypothetical protein